MASSAKSLESLNSMWTFIMSLTPTSSPETVRQITTFFEPSAVVYFNGMGAPPCTSHDSIIETITALTGYWAMAERKVTNSVVSGDGAVVVNTMLNWLKITGEDVKDFHECEVVKFSEEGLIQEYLLYCDPSPIMAVFSRKK